METSCNWVRRVPRGPRVDPRPRSDASEDRDSFVHVNHNADAAVRAELTIGFIYSAFFATSLSDPHRSLNGQ